MSFEKTLTIDFLLDKFDYNPKTGDIKWKNSKMKPLNGTVLSHRNEDGYICVRLGKHILRCHRIAWAMHYGKWPDFQIDHINGIPDDNRICNLRESNKSTNGMNRLMQSNNKSGYKGVFWAKKNKKWAAQIAKNGKKMHLGLFDSPEAASKAYSDAAMKLHGEFTRIEALTF